MFKSEEEYGESEDAFLVFPKIALGNEYWTMGYRGRTYDGARWAAMGLNSNGTTINFRKCDNTADSKSLNNGYVLQQTCAPGTAREDGTGYKIDSGSGGYNFALITGTTGADIPDSNTTSADTLLEMMPPASWAGSEYLVTEFSKKDPPLYPGDLFRIMTLEDNADVEFDVVAGGIVTPDDFSGQPCDSATGHAFTSAGEWCDVSIRDGGVISETSSPGKKILVGHFMKGSHGTDGTGTGDPSFVLVTPTNRFPCAHRFFSFDGYPYSSTTKDGSYVNIVAATSEIADVEVDGVDLVSRGCSAPIDYSTGYSWTRCLLDDNAEHTITSPSDTPVGAYVYGQRDYAAYTAAYTY